MQFDFVCSEAGVWVDEYRRWCDVCVFEACGLLFVVFCGREVDVSLGVTADAYSNAVDLFNYTSGTWSTAQLSEARTWLAATSVGNVAIFAGGFATQGGNCSFTLFVHRLVFGLTSIGDGVTFACFEACGLFVVYSVQEVAVLLGLLKVLWIPECIAMLLTCTTAHRAHGRLRSSVWRAVGLPRHLLGTWPSSRGVTEVTQVIAVLRCLSRGCCLG
jgi:hypothetical protein